MNTDEQQLARWLQTQTPEPPRDITAERIMALADRERATDVRRHRWIPVVAAASVVAVVALIVAVVTARTGQHSAPVVPATTPAPTPTSVGPSSAPPADFDLLRVIGSRGATAWKLTDHLSVTTDAGDHWSTIGLPGNLALASISSIDVGDDGAIWLAADTGQTVQVYRRDPATGTWTHTQLTPFLPPGWSSSRLPPVSSAIYTSRAGVTAIVAGWGIGEATTYEDVFVTTDNGATFAQHRTGISENIWSVTFVNDRVALAVVGPMDNRVFRTADAGRTWNQVLGGDPTLDLSYGMPVATTDGVKVPLIKGTNTGLDVSILTSTDLGTQFAAASVEALHVTSRFTSPRGTLDVAIVGDDVWVPVTGRIYRSGDGGRTWRTVPTATSVTALSIAGDGRAIGQASASCTSDRATPACFVTSYLVVTRDDGRNWHTQ